MKDRKSGCFRKMPIALLRIVMVFIFCCLVENSALYAGNKAAEMEDGVRIQTSKGMLSLLPLDDNALRVIFMQNDSKPLEEIVYVKSDSQPKYKVRENGGNVVVRLPEMAVEYDKATESLVFKDKNGTVVLAEVNGGRKMSASSVQGIPVYAIEQSFVSPADEYLYGTGQFQDGYLNIRGLSRRLTQVNTQISIPFILSNKGYGLMWENYGLTEFNPSDNQVRLIQAGGEGKSVTVDVTSTSGNKREVRNVNLFKGEITLEESGAYALLLDVGQKMARKYNLTIDGKKITDVNNLWLPPTTSAIVNLDKGTHQIEVQGDRNDRPILYWRKVTNETVFRSPVAQTIDYTVFVGSADEVISSYRELTGGTPMMPLWALGYIHCRERYNSQPELLENARIFREREIPIDIIVQDWQYWGKHGWNAMRFDEDRYPDPAQMVKELHEMDMRFMLSVWSKVDKNAELGKQMTEKGYYIPGTDWIDFFNPDAAAFYWQNFSDKLLKPYAIDAWWQDATEPENDDLVGRKVRDGKEAGEIYRNVYPMFVSKTVYEGLRKDAPEKRAMIFTRSGFSGMQRYAAATWSGDVGNDWETLRRQITAGLGMMATGLPWWTYDAGGFFRPGDQYTNTAYHECFLRWLQASTFFPLMRVHGYMSQTEPWRYGEKVEEITTKYIRLRYSLLPYIYSQAAAITFNGYTMMRPLVMDFPTDKRALEQNGQFMFGPSLLVAPVTSPAVDTWQVYLPEHSSDWIDFWDGTVYDAGQTVDVNVDLSKTPLFVKAGSIIPMVFGKQYAADKTGNPVEIRIYRGADASFVWYEDEGDNYGYEKGLYSTVKMKWDDSKNTLEIGRRSGEFPGMEAVKKLNIVLVSKDNGKGDTASFPEKTVEYDGKAVKVKF